MNEWMNERDRTSKKETGEEIKKKETRKETKV